MTKLEKFSPLAREFVGTFMLTFTAGCCSLAGSTTWNATAIGCALMVGVYATSGGHLNPAVSITLGLLRKVNWESVFVYIAVQVVAGLLAGTLAGVMFLRTATVGPVAPFAWQPACAVEVAYTAMLCFVYANCAASTRNNPEADKNQFFGLAIGFVVVAGGYAAGDISGAYFNPAVALGLDITGVSDGVKWGFVYTLCEVLGAIIAGVLFYLCRSEEFHDRHFVDYSPPLWKRLLSEFLGTFMLAFTVGLNLVTNTGVTAWSAAAALLCMIYSLGDVSGGHFNPAVTTAVVLSGRGKCKRLDGCAYACVQVLAGVLAGIPVATIHKEGPYPEVVFGLAPHAGYGWGAVFSAELVFTFLLAYVVLTTATVTLPFASKQNFYFALAIGSCVTVGGFAIGSVSGGSLNPAVSFEITMAANMKTGAAAASATDTTTAEGTVLPVSVPAPWANCIWYSLIELLGGILAASVFHLTHPQEFHKSLLM